MSGNWGGIYESFLKRCIGGARKEQEAFRELAELNKQLEVLGARKRELHMPEECWNEGTGELMEAYLKGKEEFEKERDVYAVLSPLKNLVRHREKALSTWGEELRRQEDGRRQKREQEAEEARRKHKQELEEQRRQGVALAAKVKMAKKAAEAAENARKQAKEKAEEKKEENAFSLLVAFVLWLLFVIIAYRSGARTASACLVFIPLFVVLVFYMKKKARKRALEEALKKLDAVSEKAQEEVQKAKAELAALAATCKDLLQYSIDSEKCKGCTACARKCPASAIEGNLRQPHSINQSKCVMCGTCIVTCKFGAIGLSARVQPQE